MAKKRRQTAVKESGAGASPASERQGASSPASASVAKGRTAPGRPVREPLPVGSPAAWGAIAGMLLGLGLLALGVAGAMRDDALPMPLLVALFIAGSLEAVLCWATFQRSRAAWSFATALSGTATMAFLFGSPKIRDALEVPILVALIPALIAVVVTSFLAAGASDLSS